MSYQCALLGFWQEEEDHAERDEVESGVETEGARDRHGTNHTGECDGEYCSPEQTSGDGPCHADLTVREWEDFGGVRKRTEDKSETVRG
jgi:hypothetical protein